MTHHIFTKMKRLCFWMALCLFSALLASCSSHVVRRDGPPRYYVDETKIPNATPQPEPLAKYGNMPSYVVLGKRYYTLRSSKNYDQIGVASWYGSQFNTHYTSNHERYNMLGMTAAHRTLPLPTYVEVTNLRNNRKVIVKVNDRGPFVSNRLIDLSYVAAKKLQILGHGTALVRVRAIDPDNLNTKIQLVNSHRISSPLNQTPLNKLSPATYYLQVGAFQNRSYAVQFQQRLAEKIDAPINIRNPTVGSQLYRVRLGPFNNIAEADRMSSRLQRLGIKSNKAYGA